MSRHRDVRSMNYTDEYEGYDDVYGHSVEDDYCASPGAEQFMFDRNKQANIASFFTQPDIAEDDEEIEDVPSSYKLPNLSELDTAKLMSCVEAIKNVIGDTYPESELNRKIIDFNYNTEAVLNSILNEEPIVRTKDKEPAEKDFVGTQADSKFGNHLNSNSNASFHQSNMSVQGRENLKESDTTQEFKSLSNMITNISKIEINSSSESSIKSLADLGAHHLKTVDKKPDSPSGFAIPKLKFKTSPPAEVEETSSFSSLAELRAQHLKTVDKKPDSPSGFAIPKLKFQTAPPAEVEETSSFSSLAELRAQHLKTVDKKPDSPSGFAIPKLNFKTSSSPAQVTETPSLSSLADLRAHHLKTMDKKPDSPSGFAIPKLNFKTSPAQAKGSSLFSSAAEVPKNSSDTDGLASKLSSECSKPGGTTYGTLSDLANHLLQTTQINYSPSVERKHSCNDNKNLGTNPVSFNSLTELTTHRLNSENDAVPENMNCENDNLKIASDSVVRDISNLNIDDGSDSDTNMKTEIEVNLSTNRYIKSEKVKPMIIHERHCSNDVCRMMESFAKKQTTTNHTRKVRSKKSHKSMSLFGKILCKKYDRHVPYIKKENVNVVMETVLRFDFSKPSPDSIILAKRRENR